MRRCPYLEELVKAAVNALTDSPPICVRNFEDCPLYQSEKRREDQTITRYTD